MNADLIGLYQNILDAQGIQFLLMSEPYEELEKADYGFRRKIYDNYEYKEFLQDILRNIQSNPIIFFRDDFQLNYCFFELPEIIRDEYHAKYALIGPVLYRFMSNANINQVMEQHQFPESLSKDLMEFYNRIPPLPSHDFWISLLMPLLRPLFGAANDYHFVDIADSMNHENLEQNLHIQAPSDGPSFDAIADRYKAEKALLQAVTDGNADDAVAKYHKFRQFNLSARTPDLLRNHKNWLIILNTNLRKAVDNAQVHPYYIDDLSREFAIKIESINSIPQLESLSVTMLRKYAMLAHNYSTREYSPLITKCIDEIRFYYSETLSLDILAKHCAVTPSYLSVQFHRETDFTVTDYIHNIRLEHAILLLNSTHDSIQEIASQCGFPDSNYFTRIFKKKKGITPNAYRKNIQ